jgi:hypothetical protein
MAATEFDARRARAQASTAPKALVQQCLTGSKAACAEQANTAEALGIALAAQTPGGT